MRHFEEFDIDYDRKDGEDFFFDLLHEWIMFGIIESLCENVQDGCRWS